MSMTLTLYDETPRGERVPALTLELFTSTITARELIRRRVYEEVQEQNASLAAPFRGLVQPTEAEQILNGVKTRLPRRIDWEKQHALAVRAFAANGFFLLVDDRQVENLDETITLHAGTQVSFVKLVPLIGG